MTYGEVTFFEALCRHQYWMKVIFAISLFFFLLHVPYLFVADPGSALYVIATLNLLGTAAFALMSGLAVRKCQSVPG